MNETILLYSKRLVKHSSIYGVGTLLYRAVALVMLPLYTRHLTTSDYGDLELFFITSSFLVMILQFGMGAAIFRSVIYKTQNDPAAIISTAFLFLLVANTITVSLLCFFANEISLIIFEVPGKAHLLRLIFITDFFLVMAIIPMAKLRIDESSTLFTIVALFNFVVGIVLTAVFLVGFNWGLAGVIWAQLINAIIFSIVYLFVISRDIKFRFSISDLWDMLSYGLPLVPASVATSVLLLSNRYFLKHLGNPDDVGIFSAGYRIAQVVALLVNAVQMAWPTLLFSLVKEKNAPETFSKLTTYFVFVLVTISLAISIFARELLIVITSATYLPAQFVIPLLLLANMFWGFFYMTNIGIQVKKKTYYIAIITAVGAIVNLYLNYWLISIPGFSLPGAALASLGGNFVVIVATLLISLRLYYVRYEYKKIVLIFIIAILVYLASLICPTESLILAIALKTVLLVFFLAGLYFIRFFSASEMQQAKAIVKMVWTLVISQKQNK